MMNSNKHGNLYKYDMRPVYKCSSTNNKWVRIRNPVQFSKIDETAPLSFTHVVDVSDGKVYFSFTYPYTYTMVQDELNAFSEHVNDLTNENAIYYRQELLMNSLDDKRVDLLTISSSYGASTQTEEAISGLFPNASTEQRCYVFPSKEVIFVSSRVHPGEVPAQHVFKGILDLLMDPHDLRAIELRKRYVFKLIPMLNPDGNGRTSFSVCLSCLDILYTLYTLSIYCARVC
jgi:murein tripeptide amidase MpaA